MPRKSRAILAALTAIAMALTFVRGPGPVAVIAGAFLLLTPGPAQTAALFAGRLGTAERWVLGAGLGMVSVVLCGLVLAALGEVDRRGWGVGLAAMTLAALLVAELRGRDRVAAGHSSNRRIALRPSIPRLRATSALTLALLLCGSAVWASVRSSETMPAPGFTELSMLPAVGAGAQGPVEINVTNEEERAEDYTVVLQDGNTTIGSWQFHLARRASWHAQTQPNAAGTLVARLFLRDQQTPYREVRLAPSARASNLPARNAP